VDGLSAINDITLQKRQAEVPKAKAIIKEHIAEFTDWHNMRRNVPVLKAVKEKLYSMQDCTLFQSAYANATMPGYIQPGNIQKIITNMAVKMQHQRQPGCHYIEAINDYITGRLN
jgi:glutamyl-tRNA reductase